MRTLLAALCATAILLAPAFGQSLRHGGAEKQESPQKPKSQLTREQEIQALFDILKIAPDARSAQVAERRILMLWTVTKSDTTNLLMSEVQEALKTGDADVAIKLLNSIIELKPDYFEAYNRRASIYYAKKDYSAAMEDIAAVLRLEPRHFQAMIGLGGVLQAVGKDEEALAVYRYVLKIYPRVEKIPEVVKTLEEKIDGRSI